MLELLKTLGAIVLLRRGPDSLPASWLLVFAILGLWAASLALLVAVAPDVDLGRLDNAVLAWCLSLALFAAVIAAAGYGARLCQSLAALIGTSVIIQLAQAVVLGVLMSLLGDGVASLMMDLLLLWSIFVKGSIVAQAINTHQLIGVGISIAVYAARLYAVYALSPAGAG